MGMLDYDGTLFRLPLRSRHAALRGEISDEHYDEDKCKSLLTDLWRSSEDLLVFTKNIHEVKAFVLLPDANPSQSRQLFAIEKESEGGRDIMAEFKQIGGNVKKLNQNHTFDQTRMCCAKHNFLWKEISADSREAEKTGADVSYKCRKNVSTQYVEKSTRTKVGIGSCRWRGSKVTVVWECRW